MTYDERGNVRENSGAQDRGRKRGDLIKYTKKQSKVKKKSGLV